MRILILEVDSRVSHRIYANAKWTLENSKLTLRVPMKDVDYFESMRAGDNIRLDGEIYHIDRKELAHKPPYFYAFYHIVKGEHTPSRWFKAGEVSLYQPKPKENVEREG